MASIEHAPSSPDHPTGDMVADHPFDMRERVILDIVRRFFATFARPEG